MVEVDLLRRVGAVRLDRAVQAPVRGTVGPVGRAEVAEAAEGRDAQGRAAHDVAEPVDVVAALGQQHRVRLVLATPVAADEGVRLVPPADGLEVLDADHVADRAAVDDVLHHRGVGRVAQHVRHAHHDPGPLGGLDDQARLLLGRRHRLLQQERQPVLEEGERRLRVLPVGRRDDDRVQVQVGQRQQVAPVRHAAPLRDPELGRCRRPPVGPRLGDRRHDRQPGEDALAPVRGPARPGADHRQPDRSSGGELVGGGGAAAHGPSLPCRPPCAPRTCRNLRRSTRRGRRRPAADGGPVSSRPW